MCTDSWAVTLWRTASAARLRRSRSHRAVRGHPDSISMAPLWLLSRPSLAYGAQGPGAGGARADRYRARQSQPRPPHPQGNGPPTVRYFTRPAAPSPPAGPCRLGWGPGSRISRPPRPEVTIRHVTSPSTPFSRLHEHDRLTRAAPPPRPAPVKPCGRCKHPHSALKPCIGLFDYLCASDLRSPRSSCALDPLVISALNFQISRITLLRANQS
jgi:hypothetical protein